MPAPDIGHQETDEELAALIRRIHASYSIAIEELQKKIDDYMDQFEKQDAYYRALFDSGEMDYSDFIKWRRSAVMDTKQWKDMRDQLALDLTNENEIAASMINDTLPEVYALNHNYGTYEAEVGSGYDTTYTMYDKNTVKRLLTEHEDLLPHPSVPIEKDKLWNKQHLQSAVLQGILTGEPMGDIAKRFQSVTDMTERAAMRNARTAVTGAENAGRIDSYIRAQNMGIKMKQMWMATLDGRTRDSHAMIDGEQQEVGKRFSNGCRYPGDPSGAPGEIYNCFVADTKIATDSDIIRSYKHDYSGELFTIKTAGGVEFTCTPNHPIFTPRGWIGANLLHKGDDICITFVVDKHSTRRNPNVNHVFSRIDAIHNLFDVIGRKRISALSVNFHGDIPTSDVEIVTHKRFLKDNRNSVLSEEREKFIFKSTNSLTFRNSHLMKSSRRILVSSFSFMSRLRKALSFFWRRMSHSAIHRLRSIAWSDSVILQSQTNGTSGSIQFCGDVFDRPSCVVFTDNIVDVKISTVSHVPVYNLQTEKNYYFVSSIIPDFSEKYNDIPMVIAHNCRCTLVAVVEGADPYNPNLRPSEYLKEKGLTYEQWKEMHGERFYSELFKDEQKSERKQMVSIGKSGDSYTKEQKERISELINNAPEDIKNIWNKAQADFYKTENTEGKAHYSPLGNTVYLKTELVSNGSDSHYPYQTHFHEYGHNIDYLLSDKALEPISTLYRDDKGRSFSDIIMQEWERKFTPSRKDILEKAFILNSDIEEGGSGSFNFIRETLKDYYANDIDTYYAKVRKLREIKDDEGKLKNYFYDYIDDFAKSDNIFFDYYFVQDDIQKNLENYCEDMKSKYSLKERGDLSDMLEKYSIKHHNGAYPLGMGHGKDYWDQKDDNLSIEAFAEMFSDSVSSPEALNIIKQELPESYEAFTEIVKGAIK